MGAFAGLEREVDVVALGCGVAVVAPFLIAAVVAGHPVALRLGFLGLCLLIPAYKLRLPPLATLLHAVATLAACVLLYAAAAVPAVFVVATAATAIGTIFLTRFGARLRTLGTFFFIPALYLACELREVPDGGRELLSLVLLSPLAIVMVVAVEGLRRRLSLRPPTAPPSVSALRKALVGSAGLGEGEPRWVTHAVAVFVGVAVAAAVVEIFDMSERQWVIWSAVSVVAGDRHEAVGKLQVRAIGVALGAPLGLVAGLMLPQTALVYSLALVALLMTLIAVPRYPLAFTLRSFFIGLAAVAAGGSAEIAASRVENVILGGIIGVLALLLVTAVRREEGRAVPR
jgi:hypothetical protein